MKELYHPLRIARLIVESFEKEPEGEEKEALEQWLSADGNRQLYESFRHRDLSAREEQANQIDHKKHWRAIKRHITTSSPRPKPLLRRWSIRAAILTFPILLAAALLWQQLPDRTEQTPLLATQAPVPGSSKAVLILADGQQIDLANQQAFRLQDQPEARLDNRDNTLTVKPTGNTTVTTVNYQTISIPVTGEYKLVLPDGTQIWLNSDTRLRFPTSFPGKERRIYLEGEAYFEVAPNKEQPFIVTTSDMNVRVLGTRFNVKAYREDAAIYTTLAEGAVEAVNPKKGSALMLTPNQQCVFVKKTGEMDKKEVNAQSFIGWTTGKFIFENETLEEIMKQLGRWYGTQVTYQAPELKSYRFTGHVNRFGEISTLLEMIKKTYRLHFHIQGKHITVSKY